MNIFMALIPALMWGILGIISTRLGGNSQSKTLGTTLGAFLFAIITYLFVQPFLHTTLIMIGVISGLFWTIGQQFQFKSMDYIGVSRTMPISAGMQLIVTTLISVIVFHEWKTTATIALGSVAIFGLVIGIMLISVKEKEGRGEQGNFKKGMIALLFSTFGYVSYVIILRWYHIDGWSAIFPQSVGMLIGAILISIGHKVYRKYIVRNIITGMVWATGNLFMLLSIPRVGVAVSYSLSQTGAIISTIGGIVLLGERKTKHQLKAIIIGCILIVTGGILIGMTKR